MGVGQSRLRVFRLGRGESVKIGILAWACVFFAPCAGKAGEIPRIALAPAQSGTWRADFTLEKGAHCLRLIRTSKGGTESPLARGHLHKRRLPP